MTRRIEPYARVPEAVLYDRRLTHLDVRVYGVLDRHADAGRDCWPGQDTIAALIGAKRRAVHNSICRLSDAGHIGVKRRGRQLTNRYHLNHLPVVDNSRVMGTNGPITDGVMGTKGPSDVHEGAGVMGTKGTTNESQLNESHLTKPDSFSDNSHQDAREGDHAIAAGKRYVMTDRGWQEMTTPTEDTPPSVKRSKHGTTHEGPPPRVRSPKHGTAHQRLRGVLIRAVRAAGPPGPPCCLCGRPLPWPPDRTWNLCHDERTGGYHHPQPFGHEKCNKGAPDAHRHLTRKSALKRAANASTLTDWQERPASDQARPPIPGSARDLRARRRMMLPPRRR